MNKTETLKAISELIEECKQNSSCANCTFYNKRSKYNSCLIDSEETPSKWGISEESEGV